MDEQTDETSRAGPRAYDHQLVVRLWTFVRPHWIPLAGAALLMPLSAALQLAPPYLLKVVIDEAIVPQRAERIGPLALALVVALISQQLVSFAHLWMLQLCGQRAMHDLRSAAHRHLISLRIAFFDRTPIGRVMTRVTNDVESIAEAFASGLVAVVSDAVKLVGIIVVMLWLEWRLALLTFVVVPPLVLLVGILQRLLRRTYRTIRRRLALINATLQEQISGMKVVQIFSREATAASEFKQVNRAYCDAYKTSIGYDATLFALVELLGSVTVALLLWYGGLEVLAGAVSFGLLVAFIEYVQRFFEPIRDISTKYATMQQAMAASERVFGLLDTEATEAPQETEATHQTEQGPRVVTERPARLTPPDPGGPAVDFQRVSFRYDATTPLFESLSFSVPRATSVAIVGPTGSGKSTIARLLTRLYEPQDGVVALAGADIGDLPLDELRRRVVVLSQDVFLFAGSVRDNITLGDAEIPSDKVQQAAERVGLIGLVALDKQVRERGVNLSLGQRQLVVFARALVRDPEVLVLDEATASVDPESERVVQEGIGELMRDRTAIVIAHRLTTIERVDRVLVLHRGKIVEQGNHGELIAQDGLYSRLHRLQYVRHSTVPT